MSAENARWSRNRPGVIQYHAGTETGKAREEALTGDKAVMEPTPDEAMTSLFVKQTPLAVLGKAKTEWIPCTSSSLQGSSRTGSGTPATAPDIPRLPQAEDRTTILQSSLPAGYDELGMDHGASSATHSLLSRGSVPAGRRRLFRRWSGDRKRSSVPAVRIVIIDGRTRAPAAGVAWVRAPVHGEVFSIERLEEGAKSLAAAQAGAARARGPAGRARRPGARVPTPGGGGPGDLISPCPEAA